MAMSTPVLYLSGLFVIALYFVYATPYLVTSTQGNRSVSYKDLNDVGYSGGNQAEKPPQQSGADLIDNGDTITINIDSIKVVKETEIPGFVEQIKPTLLGQTIPPTIPEPVKLNRGAVEMYEDGAIPDNGKLAALMDSSSIYYDHYQNVYFNPLRMSIISGSTEYSLPGAPDEHQTLGKRAPQTFPKDEFDSLISVYPTYMLNLDQNIPRFLSQVFMFPDELINKSKIYFNNHLPTARESCSGLGDDFLDSIVDSPVTGRKVYYVKDLWVPNIGSSNVKYIYPLLMNLRERLIPRLDLKDDEPFEKDEAALMLEGDWAGQIADRRDLIDQIMETHTDYTWNHIGYRTNLMPTAKQYNNAKFIIAADSQYAASLLFMNKRAILGLVCPYTVMEMPVIIARLLGVRLILARDTGLGKAQGADIDLKMSFFDEIVHKAKFMMKNE